MRRLLVYFASLVALLSLGLLAYWQATPTLVQAQPGPGELDVAPFSELRLSFSRAMDAESVTVNLQIEPAVPGEFSWQGNDLVFKPAAAWPSAAAIQVRLGAAAHASGLLPLSLGRDHVWSFSVRHPSLLYLSPADGPPNLYRLDPLSGASQRLTDYPAGIIDYQGRPDGRFVYYSLRTSQGGSAIYRIDPSAATGERELPPPELLLACPQATCRNPQPSPAGDYLAYERTASLGSTGPAYPQVWLLPLASDQPGDPLLVGDPLNQSYDPLWSAGGWLAFYDLNDQAFQLLQPHSGERRRFPNDTGQTGGWEGDAAFVAPEIFFSQAASPDAGLEGVAYSHLMRYDLASGAVEDLSLSQNLEDTSPVYSPDGAYLAFARKYLDLTRWTPGRQLWLARQTDRQAAAITLDPYFNHFAFAWSPQSDELVYVRFNQAAPTDPPEIWLFELASRTSRLLLEGAFSPQWIP